MDDTLDVVGLLVTVPRDLRRQLKIAAARKDMTMNAFAVAALELVATNPDVLTFLEGEEEE